MERLRRSSGLNIKLQLQSREVYVYMHQSTLLYLRVTGYRFEGIQAQVGAAPIRD